MSAGTHDAIAGDIIEIEHTDDTSASTISWTLVGRTADTIEMSPNAETADRNLHGQFQLDKVVTSEAWEVTFSRDVTVPTASMEALGLYDSSNGEVRGHYDSRTGAATNEALQISVYENEQQRSSGSAKAQYGIDEYIIVVDSSELATDDFSTTEMVVHALTRPKRLDADGTLDGTGA
ncbi:hypothetical protein [Halomarina rubra]|uniref:Uncharacterized protein n=1 Tax=Halomarina rubra TaxID=2071873 RepID=A0ABD6B214_9EURY|nr:hypothetical protein [Halomarina rubra]